MAEQRNSPEPPHPQAALLKDFAMGFDALDLNLRGEACESRPEIEWGVRYVNELVAHVVDVYVQFDPKEKDPAKAAEFRSRLEDVFERFTNTFDTKEGQEWAGLRVGALRNHIWEKTKALWVGGTDRHCPM
jgi:hypothetical protein